MSLSLSGGAPLRIAAIVGGFVVLAGGYFLLGPGKPKTATTQHHLIRHPNGLSSFAHKTTATKPKTKKATAAVKHEAAPATKPATKKATTTKPKAKAKPKPARVKLVAGLPDALAAALEQHPVVVASIYNPQASDDQIALAEAQAGAVLAGAGFAGLSVLDQDQIALVTHTFGVIDSPAVLIYQRPGQVIGQLHGFADRETVAQAVQNAAPELAAPTVTPTTSSTHAAPSPPAGSSGDPRTALRDAIPAIEKYSADHGGYVGLTTAILAAKNVVVVGAPTASSYCLRSTIGGKSWYKRGPGGAITTTACTGP